MVRRYDRLDTGSLVSLLPVFLGFGVCQLFLRSLLGFCGTCTLWLVGALFVCVLQFCFDRIWSCVEGAYLS